MSVAVLVGLAAGWLTPDDWHAVSRVLCGWNVAVWLYLATLGWLMMRADHLHTRRMAHAHADSAPVVLGVVIAATLASLAAIVLEFALIKANGTPTARAAAPHALLAAATVLGAWLLLPMEFALSYASGFHGVQPPAGLRFPEADESFAPDYGDFLYFAFTIAVAAQTSDVSVTSRAMRRLVLLQSVLSFAFNTAVLALTVNIAASLV